MYFVEKVHIIESPPQSTYSGGVSAISAGANTTTLHVIVDKVKGGRAPPALNRLGLFYHHDGMYARKWPFQLCVYSVVPSKHRDFGDCFMEKQGVNSLTSFTRENVQSFR